MIQRIGLSPASFLISAIIGSASASVIVSTTSTPSSPIWTAALTVPLTSTQTLPCTRYDCTAGACPDATVSAATTSAATQPRRRGATTWLRPRTSS
jgi:hypothetical protein